MLALANPVGGGVGQLLSPLFSDTRKGVRIRSALRRAC
jgi:hypothetical protein